MHYNAVFIVTTDVQAPSATVSSHSVTVQCNFIPGSQCRGCYAILILNDSTRSYYIERTSGSSSTEEEIVTIEDLMNLIILVFDWEEDGSIGNVSINVNITRIEEGVLRCSNLGMQCLTSLLVLSL